MLNDVAASVVKDVADEDDWSHGSFGGDSRSNVGK